MISEWFASSSGRPSLPIRTTTRPLPSGAPGNRLCPCFSSVAVPLLACACEGRRRRRVRRRAVPGAYYCVRVAKDLVKTVRPSARVPLGRTAARGGPRRGLGCGGWGSRGRRGGPFSPGCGPKAPPPPPFGPSKQANFLATALYSAVTPASHSSPLLRAARSRGEVPPSSQPIWGKGERDCE